MRKEEIKKLDTLITYHHIKTRSDRSKIVVLDDFNIFWAQNFISVPHCVIQHMNQTDYLAIVDRKTMAIKRVTKTNIER